MKKTIVLGLSAVLAFLCLANQRAVADLPPVPVADPPKVPCQLAGKGLFGDTSNGVLINGKCVQQDDEPTDGSGPADGSTSTSMTIDCGVPSNTEDRSGGWKIGCGPDTIACTPGPTDDPKVPVHAFITRTTTIDKNDKTTVTLSALWCDRSQRPVPTLIDLRQAAVKLLPTPAIAISSGHTTLVNLQTIMWLDTSADRALGTVTVVGERVAIRAHLNTVNWDFGDGATDTSTGPGKVYGHPDICNKISCDDFFGHIYTDRTGPTTITATPTWTAEYAIAGQPWAPITPDIAGATTTAQVTVKEAHAVLVPNPGHS